MKIKIGLKYIFLIIFVVVSIYIFNVYVIKKFEGFEPNYMDGVDVVYWINLDRSPERRKNMLELLDDPSFKNIPNVRISATDGKEPDKMYKKIGSYNKQKDISDYEYGCLLSHLDSIKNLSESSYNNALILEDDATLEFKPYWKKTLKDVMDNAPSDWEIIMLWYSVDDPGFISTEYEKFSWHFYTLAYLINKKGADKLMKMSENNGKYKLVDNYEHKADYYIYKALNTYMYKYPYFVYKTENDSTIHASHVELVHARNKRNAVNAYKNIKQ
jgi:GR25 family glycosyltransferase involved in LPS biosynthesis